jgi:hypothetical protein
MFLSKFVRPRCKCTQICCYFVTLQNNTSCLKNLLHSIKTRRKHRNVNFCPHVTSDNCVILFALRKSLYRFQHRAFTTSTLLVWKTYEYRLLFNSQGVSHKQYNLNYFEWFLISCSSLVIGLKSVMASERTVCLPSVSVSSKCLWRTQVTSELHEMRNRYLFFSDTIMPIFVPSFVV